MLTATTTPTIRKMPIPTIATGFLLAIAPLCRRSRAAARAGPCAPASPIKSSNSQCSARRACPVRARQDPSPLYFAARGADRMSGLPDIRHSRTLPCPALRGLACSLARKRREWSAERRTIGRSALRRARALRSALTTRRSIAAISAPGVRVSWDEAFAPVPVQQAPCGGVIVPPDRVPGPPECVLAKHARGRRTCPTSRTPLEAPLMSR